MIKTSEAFTEIINRYNANPLNEKKIYFTYTEEESDRSIDLTVEIGTFKYDATIFKQCGDITEKEHIRERLFNWIIEWLFSNLYDRMKDGTFRTPTNLGAV